MREMEKSGARVIFATTTPVARESEGRSNEEIDLYDRKAAEWMKSHGIAVCDLNAVVKSDMDEYICDDTIHLTAEGYCACAEKVREEIEKVLEEMG